MSFNGKCIGGPYDGKDIAADSHSIELMKYPAVALSDLEAQRRSHEQPEKLGTYRWTSVWVWQPEQPPAPPVPSEPAAAAAIEDQA